MFELDNNRTGYCKLVFFADLKDLIGTKLDSKKQEIEIKFKNLENDKKIHKIEISYITILYKYINLVNTWVLNSKY